MLSKYFLTTLAITYNQKYATYSLHLFLKKNCNI